MQGRDILIYLSLKYEGDWDNIYQAIKRKEPINSHLYKELITTLKSEAVTIIDPYYPEHLKQCYKPPFVIYYYGDFSLLDKINSVVAIVGSRKASDYGKKMTRLIVSDLAKKMIILSGLARGIDATAHESAININGKTIAILGSGIDYCYPKENKQLYDLIKKDHLLISEYPNSCSPKQKNFPFRNRLIAILSKSLIVTEAGINSGTLITVSHALSYGRDICCVPYPADLYSACNSLIKQGAKLVENARDVYEEMGIVEDDSNCESNLKIN
ncbi:MAG: DNA-processing protein DprA [Bacilli bacterium]|jgi:DNA processing protein|nr:DNA-protecting protein DprA [Erysipelotrichia bacterium]